MKIFIECIISVLKELSKRNYRKYLFSIVLFVFYVLLFKDIDIIKDIFKLILFELIKNASLDKFRVLSIITLLYIVVTTSFPPL